MSDFRILEGDCLEVMREMEADSVDAICTDPPYGLEFMGAEWDRLDSRARIRERVDGRTNPKNGKSTTRTPEAYIAGPPMQVFHYEWAREALRVLKPGGHLLAFGGTRTYHRMVCAIEDAGFEIRDTVQWIYGSGFPKSLNVGKAIDKMRDDDVRPVCRFLRAVIEAGKHTPKTIAQPFGFHPRMVEHWAARDTDSQPSVPKWEQWLQLKDLLGFSDAMDAEVWRLNGRKGKPGEAWQNRPVLDTIPDRWAGKGAVYERAAQEAQEPVNITAPATEAAAQWDGWGTSLKPAHEPVICATKPLGIVGYCATIIQNLSTWESELYKSTAKSAERSSEPTPPGDEKAKAGSVQTSAQTSTEDGQEETTETGEAEDLPARMDTSPSDKVMSTCLSIVRSWQSILADLCEQTSTFTTETESSLITDLQTLSSLVLQTTLEDIIQAVSQASGQTLNALTVAEYFNVVGSKLNATRLLSAQESATSEEHTERRDVTASPKHEPIVLARKPLSESSVARNVLEHGTGALNIDGCRVGGVPPSVPQSAFNSPTGQVYQMKAGEGRNGEMSQSTRGRWPANLLLSHLSPTVWYTLANDLQPEILQTIHAYYGIDKALPALRRGDSGDAFRVGEAQVLQQGVRWGEPQGQAQEGMGQIDLPLLRADVRGHPSVGEGRSPQVLLKELPWEGNGSGDSAGQTSLRGNSETFERSRPGETRKREIPQVERRALLQHSGLCSCDDRDLAGADAISSEDHGGGSEPLHIGASCCCGGEAGQAAHQKRDSTSQGRQQGEQSSREPVRSGAGPSLHESPAHGETSTGGAGSHSGARGRTGRIEVREDLIPPGWASLFIPAYSEGGCRATGEVRRVKGEGGRNITRRGNSTFSWGNGAKAQKYHDPDGTEPQEVWECHPACPVRLMDEQTSHLHSAGFSQSGGEQPNGDSSIFGIGKATASQVRHGDKGGASRFFQRFEGSSEAEPGFKYVAKASRAERNKGLEGMPEKPLRDSGNEFGKMHMWNGESGDEAWKAKNPNKPTANGHPTVKPIALMRYLCRLICPPNGTILDPFAGSGSTGCAAAQEGFNFIGIEKEAEYAEIARRRIAYWSQPEEVRTKGNGKAPAKKRTTYGFKSTDVERRCPEHGEPIPSGSITYKCGCAKVWYKTSSAESSTQVESSTLF